MKIAICAIIRLENLYLREWVEHHKKLGFDKIFLYDNNDVTGEYPHQVIGDYIMDGYVEVHNVRGYPFKVQSPKNPKLFIGLQPTVYHKCRMANQKEYEWMAFIDVDEFITISENEPQNIHDIFEKYGYASKGYEQVLMSWYTIGNDGKINYENKPVQERFTIHKGVEETERTKNSISDYWVKSIVRTDVPADKQFRLGNEHAINDLYSCSEYGLYIPTNDHGECCMLSCTLQDILYVKHYFSKSLWEHLARKIINTDPAKIDVNNTKANVMRMQDFKDVNGWDEQCEQIFEKFVDYINSKE